MVQRSPSSSSYFRVTRVSSPRPQWRSWSWRWLQEVKHWSRLKEYYPDIVKTMFYHMFSPRKMLLVLTHFRRQAVTFSYSLLRIPTWFWFPVHHSTANGSYPTYLWLLRWTSVHLVTLTFDLVTTTEPSLSTYRSCHLFCHNVKRHLLDLLVRNGFMRRLKAAGMMLPSDKQADTWQDKVTLRRHAKGNMDRTCQYHEACETLSRWLIKLARLLLFGAGPHSSGPIFLPRYPTKPTYT